MKRTMTNDTHPAEGTDDRGPAGRRWSRRRLLGLMGLGGVGLLAGCAETQPNVDLLGDQSGQTYDWRRDVDANGHGVTELGAISMTGGGPPITRFDGANLSVDADGVLNATTSGSKPSVSDDGAVVASAVEDIDFGVGLSATDDGHGTVTVTGTGSGGGRGAVGPSVYLDFSEPFPEGDQQIIPYDAVNFDPRDEFDAATHQITIAESGYYHVDAQAAISRESGGGDPVTVCIRVVVNGDIVANSCGRGGNDFFGTYGAISRVIDLEADDTVEIHGFVINEEGTGDYLVSGGAGYSTFLTVHRVE